MRLTIIDLMGLIAFFMDKKLVFRTSGGNCLQQLDYFSGLAGEQMFFSLGKKVEIVAIIDSIPQNFGSGRLFKPFVIN